MSNTCKVCGRSIVVPNGPRESDILIIGEFPGEDEINIGLPFVGRTGDVLRYELAVVGITLDRCRVTNLWKHQQLSTGSPCFQDGMAGIMDELQVPRKGVLFMGSELPTLFGLPSVMSISGLVFESVPIFGYPYITVFMPNPAIVFHSSLGEVRHALSVFSKSLKGKEVYPNV